MAFSAFPIPYTIVTANPAEPLLKHALWTTGNKTDLRVVSEFMRASEAANAAANLMQGPAASDARSAAALLNDASQIVLTSARDANPEEYWSAAEAVAAKAVPHLESAIASIVE